MNEMTQPVTVAHTQNASATTERGPDTILKSRRKRLFLGLAAGVLAAGCGFFAYDKLVLAPYAVTDDAYVGADIAQITPLIGGPVAQVLVGDTQQVHRGDVLVRLDDTDARLALAQAQAKLFTTERRYNQMVATNAGLEAQITGRVADQAQAEANLAGAQADVAKAKIDLARRRSLAASGGVSGDELTDAQNALSTAQAKLNAAQAAVALSIANVSAAVSDRDATAALISGTAMASNPDVLAAQAAVDQARVNLSRTAILAPVDGIVTDREVQIGQRVEPGAMLMSVVPIEQAYVDANFKEVQLANVHSGQSVTLQSDLYGSAVKYTGHVVGFSGGTGAAFAVVPAQNATGNWIKVVQRLPVRIALDPQQLKAHPLRVGLSMTASIDLGE